MKTIQLVAIIGLIGHTVLATEITVNEDTSIRLDFEIHWGSEFSEYADWGHGSGGSDIAWLGSSNRDVHFFLVEVFRGGRFVAPVTAFSIRFASSSESDRMFASPNLQLGLQLPDFIHALPDDPYGARFIYGEDVHPSVPDGGSTLMLLGGALATLCYLKRVMRV